MKQREILVTNDDGFAAPGINIIAELLREYGNVTVVAPKYPQSGKSAAITLDKPLEIDLIREEPAAAAVATGSDGSAGQPEKGSLKVYSLTGTPVDCAKLGINIYIHKGTMPDLLISGVNHGSNASAASIYSGTLGAATEGTIYGVPSIGLSIDTHRQDVDFGPLVHYSRILLDKYFENGFIPGVFLNVNFPVLPLEQIKGFKVAHQGHGRWVREFDHRVSPRGRHYFWMVGEFEDHEEGVPGCTGDHALIKEGWISIVPHKVDTTDYEEAERLKKIWDL